MKEKITVVGLGYIGLPTASLLANRGYNVHGIDVNQSTVDIINQGKIHIVEPELDTFVQSAVNSGRLVASMDAVESDIFIIAVPTPFKENKVPDLSYVESAVNKILPFLKKNDVIVLESTSPVGTTAGIEKQIYNNREDLRTEGSNTKLELWLAYCPERVLPGHIIKELVENDRIVGGLYPEDTKVVAKFYKTFVEGKILETNASTAEMAKISENSYRDVNIAFANELSMISHDLGIDVNELISLTNHHPRVNILSPGCGVGGHCIAIDPWFVVHGCPEQSQMIALARKRNLDKTKWVKDRVVESVKAHKNKGLNGPKVVCLGLAYKQDIDDLRESPAMDIYNSLTFDGYNVVAVEPNVESCNGVKLESLEEAMASGDIFVLLVSHKEFIEKVNDFKGELLDFVGISK